MQQTLPIAWRCLIDEQDELLIELIATKVEEICGYKPDSDTVAHFLEQPTGTNSIPPDVPTSRPPRPAAPVGPETAPASGGTRTGYGLNGQEFQARNAIRVLLSVLKPISSRDDAFMARFAGAPHESITRGIARTADELYPGRPHFGRDYSHQLSSGWWLGTNYSRASIRKILQMASEVAGLQFGTDLIVHLG